MTGPLQPGGLRSRRRHGPHVGSLSGLDTRHPAAELSGHWVVTIFDVRNDDGTNNGNPPQFLNYVDLHVSGLIENTTSGGFGDDTIKISGTIPGAADQTYPTGTGANGVSPTLGVGPNPSLAYDTSLGSFSPYSGRLYLVTTGGGGTNTNVFIIWSDNNGATWSNAVQVNDDTPSDQFSEGNRHQFMPNVTVDPVTGAVIVMWYDARTDASNGGRAQFMAVSTDSGAT